jgi:NAD(P)-dependent dehydrogenase (short-subunit alcohol dehydrogenase family)
VAHIVGIDVCSVVDPGSGVTPATKKDLDETAALVRTTGQKWREFVVDQRDIGALRSTVPQIEAELGGIDILFAKRRNSSLSSSARDGRSRLAYSNRREPHSTANAIRTFAPALVRRGGGRIIVTSSTQGRHGTVYGAAYSASKLGIIGLMKSAALELGRYGIPVNAPYPRLD